MGHQEIIGRVRLSSSPREKGKDPPNQDDRALFTRRCNCRSPTLFTEYASAVAAAREVEDERIRRAVESDIPGVAMSLARAFADDPVTQWMVPSAQRHRRLVRMFSLIVGLQLRFDETYTTADNVGAAVWDPPNSWRLDTEAMTAFANNVNRIFGTKLSRALDVLTILEENHPEDPPHWYLGILGTHPDWQSRGIGAALLGPILTRADAEGLPIFLESSKDRNIPYYRRFGFEVSGELTVPNGGPHLWPMWRDPVERGTSIQ
jgi:GNAT superfamily N-acetyltransferase